MAIYFVFFSIFDHSDRGSSGHTSMKKKPRQRPQTLKPRPAPTKKRTNPAYHTPPLYLLPSLFNVANYGLLLLTIYGSRYLTECPMPSTFSLDPAAGVPRVDIISFLRKMRAFNYEEVVRCRQRQWRYNSFDVSIEVH